MGKKKEEESKNILAFFVVCIGWPVSEWKKEWKWRRGS